MVFIKFLIIIALVYFALVLQASRVFSFYGVQPNFVLVSFLILASMTENTRDGRVFMFFLDLVFLGLVFGFFGFWFWEAFIALLLALAVFCVRRFLTGNRTVDFFVMVFATTVIFNLIVYFTKLGGASFSVVFWEGVYNLILGFALWYFPKKNTL